MTVGPLRDGARVRTDRVHDAAGRLTSVAVGAAEVPAATPAGPAEWAEEQCDGEEMTEPVVTDYTYGELGRLEQVTSPGGVETSYAYDDDGNVTATTTGTDTNDDTSTRRTAYDLRGRVTDEWGPTGDVDENGNDVRSHVRYHYDTADRLTETEVLLTGDSIDTAASGDVQRTWHLYDSAGRKVYDIVDLNGNDGTPQQDATGALTVSEPPQVSCRISSELEGCEPCRRRPIRRSRSAACGWSSTICRSTRR